METKYYIIDTTSNSPSLAIVFDESGETIHSFENCISFNSSDEAQALIDDNGWDWAGIIEL